MNFKNASENFKKIIITILLITAIINILTFNEIFKLNEITIEGNYYYSKEELLKLLDLKKQNNVLISYSTFYFEKNKTIPFVEDIKFQIKSFNHINIKVFEKKIIGCLEYMGMYLYFNKDGILVESSEEHVDYIPIVNGLIFNNLVLHKQIPVKNIKVFRELLNIGIILEKLDIKVDTINIIDNTFILNKKALKIVLGTSSMIDEKLNTLNNILPNIDLKNSGEIDLRKAKNKKIILKKIKKK